MPNTIVKVQSVIDGDTVHVIGPKDEYIKIRLLGIDAPEIDQPYGKEARNHLRNILPREVRMTSGKQDQYGRYSAILRSIRRGSGPISYNERMIRDGYATYEPDYGKIPNGREAQNYAKINKLGIWWKDDLLERPRTFRRRKNQKPVDYPIKHFPTTTVEESNIWRATVETRRRYSELVLYGYVQCATVTFSLSHRFQIGVCVVYIF